MGCMCTRSAFRAELCDTIFKHSTGDSRGAIRFSGSIVFESVEVLYWRLFCRRLVARFCGRTSSNARRIVASMGC